MNTVHWTVCYCNTVTDSVLQRQPLQVPNLHCRCIQTPYELSDQPKSAPFRVLKRLLLLSNGLCLERRGIFANKHNQTNQNLSKYLQCKLPSTSSLDSSATRCPRVILSNSSEPVANFANIVIISSEQLSIATNHNSLSNALQQDLESRLRFLIFFEFLSSSLRIHLGIHLGFTPNSLFKFSLDSLREFSLIEVANFVKSM